jgi:hypothetical protein
LESSASRASPFSTLDKYVKATFAPSAINCSAMALPMPLDAPVISATLFVNKPMVDIIR